MIVYVPAQYFCIHRQVVPSPPPLYPERGERVEKDTGLAYYGKKKQFIFVMLNQNARLKTLIECHKTKSSFSNVSLIFCVKGPT